MINDSLFHFGTRILQKNRISFGDVQRLQRNILPDGIGSREEAELLIGLDRRVGKSDPGWGRFLVAMMVDFVVWGERPTGVVDEDTARWLAAVLAEYEGCGRKNARLMAREIVEEAQAFENDALLALAGLSRTSRGSRGAQCRCVAHRRDITVLPNKVASFEPDTAVEEFTHC